MATFLDVSGLAYFSNIFVFLFVWLVVFAIFSWVKVLGSNKFIHALVGLLLAIFVLISPIATGIVASIAPFVAVIFVLVVLVSIASHMFGAGADAFPALKGVFIVFMVIIVVVAAGVKIREQIDVPAEAQTDLSKTVNLLFHPTFLGTVLIFAIAIFTIALLASRG